MNLMFCSYNYLINAYGPDTFLRLLECDENAVYILPPMSINVSVNDDRMNDDCSDGCDYFVAEDTK